MVTPSKYGETELINLLKNADSKGFAYLYKNYSKALSLEIKSIVSDPEIVEDVLQEVFIAIYRKIETYNPNRGHLYTWMVAIARNQSIDTVLSKGYRNSRQLKQLTSAVESPSPSTTANVDNIGLHRHLKKIKTSYWDVLYLNYFQGHTHEEISNLLNMPLGTVKTRIKAGLLQLRKLMNE